MAVVPNSPIWLTGDPEADRLLTDDAALIPLTNRVGAIVVRPELGNVMTRSGYGPLIDQIWVK